MLFRKRYMIFLIYIKFHFFIHSKTHKSIFEIVPKKRIESVNYFARYSQKGAMPAPQTISATHVYRVGVGGEISSMTLTTGKRTIPPRGAAPHQITRDEMFFFVSQRHRSELFEILQRVGCTLGLFNSDFWNC